MIIQHHKRKYSKILKTLHLHVRLKSLIEKVYNLRVWFRLTGLASSEKKQHEKHLNKRVVWQNSSDGLMFGG